MRSPPWTWRWTTAIDAMDAADWYRSLGTSLVRPALVATAVLPLLRRTTRLDRPHKADRQRLGWPVPTALLRRLRQRHRHHRNSSPMPGAGGRGERRRHGVLPLGRDPSSRGRLALSPPRRRSAGWGSLRLRSDRRRLPPRRGIATSTVPSLTVDGGRTSINPGTVGPYAPVGARGWMRWMMVPVPKAMPLVLAGGGRAVPAPGALDDGAGEGLPRWCWQAAAVLCRLRSWIVVPVPRPPPRHIVVRSSQARRRCAQAR